MKIYICIIIFLFASNVFAQEIHVKYRNTPVDVSNGHFERLELKPSSFVNEMYYDKGNKYLLVRLKYTFYHYCGISSAVVENWLGASSLGRHYNYNIKGNYDCRVNYMPAYGTFDDN